MTDDHEHPADAPEQEITSETPEFAAEMAARTVEPSAKRDAAKKPDAADSSSITEASDATDAEPEDSADAPQPKLERLQKILAQAGIASRRHAEELITQGRVQVNGQTVTVLGTKADPARDHIRVDGKLLHGAERLRYFVLNKPKGYVTTVTDPEGRPTVMEFFAKTGERLYPVGRLDYQSEGLLLVTNDGELANQLTRAASGVEKTYLVKVAGRPHEEQIERLRSGVAIDKGRPREGKVHTAPATIRQIRKGDNPWFEVVLIEGRNRELRKMFEEIGHHVEKIRRVGYGPLVLDVAPGKTRELYAEEVEALRLTAAGKLKPRRPKATHMLPKDAGKRADVEQEKPRRFDRKAGSVQTGDHRERREGRFERPRFEQTRPEQTEERRPAARPPFGERPGGRPAGRPGGRFDRNEPKTGERPGRSGKPFQRRESGGRTLGAGGQRREPFRRDDDRGERRGGRGTGFGSRPPMRGKRNAEDSPRPAEGRMEGRRPPRAAGFTEQSRERGGPQRRAASGFRPRGGEQREDRPGQRPGKFGGRQKTFGEGAEQRERGAKPFRIERLPAGEESPRGGRPARPFGGARKQGSSFRGKPGGKPGGRPGGKPAGGVKRSGPRPGGKRNFGRKPK